jgi:hypothetical protein
MGHKRLPPALLSQHNPLETTADSFVYIESWDAIERQENVTGASKLIIETTPVAKRLIRSRIEGQTPIKHDEQLRELNEFFEVDGDAQWRLFKQVEIPTEIVTTLVQAVK